jgi:hypothetical protein
MASMAIHARLSSCRLRTGTEISTEFAMPGVRNRRSIETVDGVHNGSSRCVEILGLAGR